MWQEQLQPWIDAGNLTVIGVVQEQHAERALLYRQWRGFDWPIAVDALNSLGLSAVPIVVALNADGSVWSARMRPRMLGDFMRESDAQAAPTAAAPVADAPVAAGMAAADALFYAAAWDDAVAAYEKMTSRDARDGAAWFRLGVALRRRCESPGARADDAQRAVRSWEQALALDPNQYIWRRRIQQYGPRLAKPYPFYNWVDQARQDIRQRGARPVELNTEPSGAEIIALGVTDQFTMPPEPDAAGRVLRDRGLIRAATMVTPSRVRPGGQVRLRATLRPDAVRKPWWNNETGPLLVWLDLPDGWRVTEGVLSVGHSKTAESREIRIVDVEVQLPSKVSQQSLNLPGYALYYVCEHRGGMCRYLRQDLEFRIEIDGAALQLK